MIKQLIGLGIALWLVVSIAAFASPSPVDELSQLLATLNNFSANFKEETYNTHQTLMQTSHGTVKLQRPGHFKWETLEPTHQLLITNGRDLWIYDVDLAQVTQDHVQDQGNLSPAQLLSGSTQSLEKQFTITAETKSQYLLIPKDKESEFKWIRFIFKNRQLQSMQFENQLGEKNIFRFISIRNDIHFKGSEFEFKPPHGVDVLVNS